MEDKCIFVDEAARRSLAAADKSMEAAGLLTDASRDEVGHRGVKGGEDAGGQRQRKSRRERLGWSRSRRKDRMWRYSSYGRQGSGTAALHECSIVPKV